ncbi:permease prefix domain 1-containing protein [Microbacterium maritypicum]
MPTTATLTERYIGATIRSLRPEAQGDVRAELEASIADAIEARLEHGETPESAERAVLTELGDPGLLAAGYADRPLHLIGPRYYLTWWRLLKLLLWIVPAFAAFGVALAKILEFATLGETIGAVVVAVITSIVHVGFWTTLVFALLERTATDPGTSWDVDQLPEPVDRGAGRNEVIGSLIFLALAAGAILWDALRGFVRDDGAPVPILNPTLWPVGLTVLLVLMLAELALAVAIYRRGRWTVGAAIVNTVLAIAFVVPAMYLLVSGELVNPAFLQYLAVEHASEMAQADAGAAEQGGVLRILSVILGVVIVGSGIWDIVDGWIKTARASRV